MLTVTGPPAYMIVGLLVWADATFKETIDLESKKNAKGKVPVGTIGASVSSRSPIQGEDPEVEMSAGSTLHTLSKGFSPGSNIFAFEYKIVRRKLSSSTSDKPSEEEIGDIILCLQ